MQVPERVRSFWNAIRGNVYWELVKLLPSACGGGALFSLSTHLFLVATRSPQVGKFGLILLAMLGALLIVLTIIAVKLPALVGQSTRTVLDPSSETAQPSQHKETELRGSVEGLWFGEADNPLSYSYPVTLKLRIVNYGPVEAYITEWKLISVVGEEQSEGTIVDMTPGLAIKRQTFERYTVDAQYKFEPLDVDIRAMTLKYPLRRGAPVDGWAVFTVSAYRFEPAVNARLVLFLTDSLGGTHIIERPAQNYIKDGEVAAAPSRGLVAIPLIGQPH